MPKTSQIVWMRTSCKAFIGLGIIILFAHFGCASQSEWVGLGTTTLNIPPGVPLNFGVSNVTSNSIAVRWDTPKTGGKVEGYYVEITDNTNGVWSRVITTTNAVVFGNLQYATRYWLRCASTNSP